MFDLYIYFLKRPLIHLGGSIVHRSRILVRVADRDKPNHGAVTSNEADVSPEMQVSRGRFIEGSSSTVRTHKISHYRPTLHTDECSQGHPRHTTTIRTSGFRMRKALAIVQGRSDKGEASAAQRYWASSVMHLWRSHVGLSTCRDGNMQRLTDTHCMGSEYGRHHCPNRPYSTRGARE
jgi:hypothetical protein